MSYIAQRFKNKCASIDIQYIQSSLFLHTVLRIVSTMKEKIDTNIHHKHKTNEAEKILAEIIHIHSMQRLII